MFGKTAVIRWAPSIVILAASLSLSACSKPAAPQQIVEQPAVPPASEAGSQPAKRAELAESPPPTPEEVEGAVRRVFKDVVVVDRDGGTSFLVGDFNGDLSQDLAVILKPGDGKLSQLNQEFPSWLAREPLKDVLLPKSKALSRNVALGSSSNPASGQTVRFEQSDVLMAIIHGEGPKGWRDPEAAQTHLLRDVVGANMKTMPFNSAVKVYQGVKPFPTIYGDLIQQSLIGHSGFLYFTGGIYGWYDPNNYTPGPVPVHSRMSAMK